MSLIYVTGRFSILKVKRKNCIYSFFLIYPIIVFSSMYIHYSLSIIRNIKMSKNDGGRLYTILLFSTITVS